MRGIAYGVGVGPGDPELMTLKACRLIRENDCIALPGKEPKATAAYRIAVRAVPELADKELIPVDMPMCMDRDVLRESHRRGAARIEAYLAQGKNVVFLTLGDPTVYCTFTYLQPYLEADGYETELVSGIPSFCAAAARLNIPLVARDEPLHVFPAVKRLDRIPDHPGTWVLMKTGSHMKEVKEYLRASGRQDIQMVQDCGMDSEQIYRDPEEIPDAAGYFSLIIAKDKKRG